MFKLPHVAPTQHSAKPADRQKTLGIACVPGIFVFAAGAIATVVTQAYKSNAGVGGVNVIAAGFALSAAAGAVVVPLAYAALRCITPKADAGTASQISGQTSSQEGEGPSTSTPKPSPAAASELPV